MNKKIKDIKKLLKNIRDTLSRDETNKIIKLAQNFKRKR